MFCDKCHLSKDELKSLRQINKGLQLKIKELERFMLLNEEAYLVKMSLLEAAWRRIVELENELNETNKNLKK